GRVVTLTNIGHAALHFVQSPSLIGQNPAEFRMSAVTCKPTVPVLPGGDCKVTVFFHPKRFNPQAMSASISFIDDAAGSPQTVALFGHTVLRLLQFDPASVDFGNQ